ncbi:MOSC domain-containing protein [Novosphingobium aquimarinum]|uniref:MOSC domain-containing protein n=1 Tax=Novosphingobium aquimarinum TaxID=2682494 RepID=UPI0012EB530C|nr:MOSC domain-containing protein [Novosphingobium aquimarinum]
MTIPVLSIQCGSVGALPDGTPSAIAKAPAKGPVRVTRLGLEGDAQADLAVHGGPDKAVHHYPHDHYSWWGEAIGAHPLLATPGAFGENVSTEGLTEETVAIGDVYRLGSALVEVSHGRQPCFKLDARFGRRDILSNVVGSRRSGWYYRVLEEGAVEAGDALDLVERPWPDWTVARVFGLLIAGDHKRDRAGLEALGAVAALAEPWAKRRAALLG